MPHPTTRAAFASCDVHLAITLAHMHGHDTTTKRWRVSHLETADEHYRCHCLNPGHWFFLQLPDPDPIEEIHIHE